MRLEIPFYKQTTHFNCGPMALRMVIAYLDKDLGVEILEKRAGIKEGKGLMTAQIATAAALSGYKTDLFSKSISFNPKNLELEFYKKYSEEIQRSEKVVEDAKKAGVNIEEKTLSSEEILKSVNEKSVPIILLDWNVVMGRKDKGYQGHFVPIVGYDSENVYIHDHGTHNPTPFLPIKREIFEVARKAKGTDEDIIIIHGK